MFNPTLQMWQRRAGILKTPVRVFLWGLKYILVDSVPINLILLLLFGGAFWIQYLSVDNIERFKKSPIPTQVLVRHLPNVCYKNHAQDTITQGGNISQEVHREIIEKCGITDIERQNEHLEAIKKFGEQHEQQKFTDL